MSDRVRLGLSELSEVPCPPRPQQSDRGTMAGALAAGFQFTSNLSHLPHMRPVMESAASSIGSIAIAGSVHR